MKYDSIRECNYSDHHPVYSHLSFDLDKQIESGWEVPFSEINAWYEGVPLHISFNGKDFWKRNGHFRDWLGLSTYFIEKISVFLGVYKVPNINERCPITFTNIMLCVDYGTHYLAEFISLPADKYVVAYHSYNDSCIKGMTNVFTVTNFS